MEFISGDCAVAVDVDEVELGVELLLHVVLQARFFDPVIDYVGGGRRSHLKPRVGVLSILMG